MSFLSVGSLKEDGKVPVSGRPYLVSHSGTQDFTVLSRNELIKTPFTRVPLYIDPKCNERKWLSISTTSNKAVLTNRQTLIHIPIELEADEEGTSWSEVCGKATVDLLKAPNFVTVDAAGVVKINPRGDEAAGNYEFIVR